MEEPESGGQDPVKAEAWLQQGARAFNLRAIRIRGAQGQPRFNRKVGAPRRLGECASLLPSTPGVLPSQLSPAPGRITRHELLKLGDDHQQGADSAVVGIEVLPLVLLCQGPACAAGSILPYLGIPLLEQIRPEEGRVGGGRVLTSCAWTCQYSADTVMQRWL